ncbi:MAG: hypothetical protein ACYC6J_07165 [Coriobacteriia bacterium]
MVDTHMPEERPAAPDHTCTLVIEELVSHTPEEVWEDDDEA